MASSSSSSVKVPVFIDTSLETHIVMTVSSEITVGELKREFSREHSICFPNLGNIRITGLMVKRKSFFYHLPDSMVIKNVFQGLKGIWFIHIDADLVKNSNCSCSSDGIAEIIRESDVNRKNVTEAQTQKEKCFNQEAVDEGKNRLLSTNEKELVISSQRHFCNGDTRLEPNLIEEQINLEAVKNSNYLSEGIAEIIRESDVNLKNVTEAQAQKEKCCNVEIVDDDKNKFLSTTENEQVISALCNVDTRLEPNIREEQINQEVVKNSNYPYLSDDTAVIFRESDVNLSTVTEVQTHENHIKGRDKNNMENTSRKMKKKRTMRLEDLMTELLMPVSIAKKKRKKEKSFNQDVVDEGKNKFLSTTEEEPVISSLCNVDTRLEPDLREEQINQEVVKNSNYPYLSEGIAEIIKESDGNLRNVTEAQTHENHIKDIDKNNMENTSRKSKKKRIMRLEGLMEEILMPVSVGKKKRRIKEKCFNQEVVHEGTNKFLSTTEEEPVISSERHFCSVDTRLEPNHSKEQINQEIVDEGKNKFPSTTEEELVISSQKHFCNMDTRKELNHREEQISPATVGISTVSSPEIVSVTGIITRYFPEFDEVKPLNDHSGCDIGDELQSCTASQGQLDKSSKTVKTKHCRQPPEANTLLSAKTLTTMLSHPLPADPSPETPRREFGRTEVGKRLVLAANDLKISNSNKISSTNICQSIGGKFSPSVVRTLVFEVTNSDC